MASKGCAEACRNGFPRRRKEFDSRWSDLQRFDLSGSDGVRQKPDECQYYSFPEGSYSDHKVCLCMRVHVCVYIYIYIYVSQNPVLNVKATHIGGFWEGKVGRGR